MFSGGELPPKGLSWDSLGLKTWGWLSGTTGIGGGSEQKILKGGRQFELSNKKESFSKRPRAFGGQALWNKNPQTQKQQKWNGWPGPELFWGRHPLKNNSFQGLSTPRE